MPNQRMNSGTQAIEGMARSACRVGSKPVGQRRIAGDRTEQVPATTPKAKPGDHPPQRRGDVARAVAGAAQLGEGLRK